MFAEGAGGAVFDAIMKRDGEEAHLYERSPLDDPELFERDFEDLDARSFDASELDIRSLNDVLEARSFDDILEARSFDGENLEARDFYDAVEFEA